MDYDEKMSSHGNALFEPRRIVRPFEWGRDTFPPHSTVAQMLGLEHHVYYPKKKYEKPAYTIDGRDKEFRERFKKYRKEIYAMVENGFAPSTIAARYQIGRVFMVRLFEEEMKESQKFKYPYLQKLREKARLRQEAKNK